MKHGGNVWQGGNPADWLDFSANLRPEGPPDWVKRVMEASLALARYYPDRALSRARRGIAEYARVPERCVLPTAGGTAAIGLACALRPGTVFFTPPTFGGYAEAARAYSRRAAAYSSADDLAPGDLRFLCNPNNPTGEALSKDAVLAEAALCRSRSAALAVDEAFIDFCPEHSVRAEAAVRDGLIVVGSLTKSLCVPGIRLGYLIAREDTVEKAKQYQPGWPLNTLAAAIAAEVPGHAAALERDRRLNAERRGQLAAGLRALGAAVHASQSNFLLAAFARPMAEIADTLKKEGILVRTCSSFGLDDRFLRLAVKTPPENERLLDALSRCLPQ